MALSGVVDDRYAIERELGRGGMATVYLARDQRQGNRVAIKVLTPDFASVVGGERFSREIRITAGLQHPHILPVFDSGEVDGLPYFVMPFVEGPTVWPKQWQEISRRGRTRAVSQPTGGLHNQRLRSQHSRGVIRPER